MSDIMLLGVLRMPYEMAMSDEMSRLQFHSRAQEAADRIVSDEAEIARLTDEVNTLRSWDDYFRKQCGYKRDGRSSPECLDEYLDKVLPDTDPDLTAAQAEIAQLKAERNAAMAGPIRDITDADMKNIVAHLSYELEPQGPLPNRNSLMMEVVRLSNSLAAIQPDTERAEPVADQPVATPVYLTLTYTNWRGETALRTIIPRRVWFGSTDWHPEPQWLLTALDVEKKAHRDFALKDFGIPQAREITVQEAAEVLPNAWDLARVIWEARKYAAWGKDAGAKLIERTPWQNHATHPLVATEHELAHAEAKAALRAIAASTPPDPDTTPRK